MPARIGNSSPAPSSAPAPSTHGDNRRTQPRAADRGENDNNNDCADAPAANTPATTTPSTPSEFEDGQPPTRERIVALLAEFDMPAEFVDTAVEFASRPLAERMLLLYVELLKLGQSVQATSVLVQAQKEERDQWIDQEWSSAGEEENA